MTPIKIESGIPVPPQSNRAVFPLRQLKIGETFYAPAHLAGTNGKKIYTAIQNYQRKHGVKFTARKVGRGFRVWRTA